MLTVVDIGAGLEMGLGAVFITRPGETDPVGTRSSNAMSVVVSSAIDLLAKFLSLAIWRDTGPVCNHGSGNPAFFVLRYDVSSPSCGKCTLPQDGPGRPCFKEC